VKGYRRRRRPDQVTQGQTMVTRVAPELAARLQV